MGVPCLRELRESKPHVCNSCVPECIQGKSVEILGVSALPSLFGHKENDEGLHRSALCQTKADLYRPSSTSLSSNRLDRANTPTRLLDWL